MIKKLLLFWLGLGAMPALAQPDSTGQVTFNGFIDVYYGFDFNQPQNHQRPGFLYNHNRHNEFNLNLGFLKAAYASSKVRGNLALMVGTYAQYNLATEPSLLKNVFEANAGVNLSKNLWLDAGIFSSHIGVESAISTENLTLTRSLAAENSPYYESGVKITYEAGPKWVFTGLVLNGWQNIQEQPGNSNKAIGTQIQFKPVPAVLLNSSTFIGNEKPDSLKQRRYFHDFYASVQVSPKFKVAAVFDIGFEKSLAKQLYQTWYTPVLILHYRFSRKMALAGRAEYYHDPNGIIINTNTPVGFKTSGYSLNLDYAPVSHVLLRLEGRVLHSYGAIFTRRNELMDKSTAFTSSVAISF